MTITPKMIVEEQVSDWIDAVVAERGLEHVRRLARFWAEAEQGKRMIWIIRNDGAFAGHITLQPDTQYPPFKKQNIPEIVDLWVDPAHRRHGFGERLLLRAIEEARTWQASAVGLGVGVTRSFGQAHRLYARNGFMMDGTGLWHRGRATEDGETITLDEQTLMMLVKRV